MDYDLVRKGGPLSDAKNDIDGPADLAIKDGKIAAVGPDIAGTATKTVNVAGHYVTPGLIDIHLHAYCRFAGWLYPDPHCLPSWVPHCVDTGTARCPPAVESPWPGKGADAVGGHCSLPHLRG